MQRRLLPFLAILIAAKTYSQDGDFNLGARNGALAGASSTIEDSWAIYNNVAGLATLSATSGMISYQNRFGLSEFQVVGAAFVQPTKFVNTGLSFYRFGDEIFNQQQMKLALANQIDRISLGVAADWVQVSIEGLGTTSAIVLEFGGIATITDQLRFSGHAYNINQARLTEEETLPTILKAGIGYQPTNSLQLIAEMQKDLDFDEILKVGLEYEISANVWIRTGISTNPFKAAFGAGTNWKNLRIDYAFTDQTDLGAIHEFSIAYSIKTSP